MPWNEMVVVAGASQPSGLEFRWAAAQVMPSAPWTSAECVAHLVPPRRRRWLAVLSCGAPFADQLCTTEQTRARKVAMLNSGAPCDCIGVLISPPASRAQAVVHPMERRACRFCGVLASSPASALLWKPYQPLGSERGS